MLRQAEHCKSDSCVKRRARRIPQAKSESVEFGKKVRNHRSLEKNPRNQTPTPRRRRRTAVANVEALTAVMQRRGEV